MIFANEEPGINAATMSLHQDSVNDFYQNLDQITEPLSYAAPDGDQSAWFQPLHQHLSESDKGAVEPNCDSKCCTFSSENVRIVSCTLDDSLFHRHMSSLLADIDHQQGPWAHLQQIQGHFVASSRDISTDSLSLYRGVNYYTTGRMHRNASVSLPTIVKSLDTDRDWSLNRTWYRLF
jgi:hypothetical protein